MQSASPSVLDTSQLVSATFTFSLNQNAGTYNIGTVSVGGILIQDITIYNSVAATGLTSVAMATDDTTPATILSTVLLASLTGGVNLTPYSTRTYLPSGKHIQGTIVGNGTAGAIIVVVRYYRTVTGANIA
jgi:hypothetical protein